MDRSYLNNHTRAEEETVTSRRRCSAHTVLLPEPLLQTVCGCGQSSVLCSQPLYFLISAAPSFTLWTDGGGATNLISLFN